MPIIREYHRCGNCGKKQAGVQEVYPGRWEVRCRSCGCDAHYGDSPTYPGEKITPWPGGAQAAADLLYSFKATLQRRMERDRAYTAARQQAYADMYQAARVVVAQRTAASIDRLTAAFQVIDTLETKGSAVFPPFDPLRSHASRNAA